MAEMMRAKEAASLWNLTERRVTGLCREGKITGARKEGRSWMIPADAEKPADSRVKSGTYQRAGRPSDLPLPVGISDYRLASSQYYYIDKTLLIKEFLDERPMVSLFTRPRRFGKTLNMDMLRTFFEITEEDTSVYFKDKKIWACGKMYQQYQGKYPVIFLTFKDTKFTSWEATLQDLSSVIAREFDRHKELLDSPRCSEQEKEYLQKVIAQNASEVELASALLTLSEMLHKHHGTAPIIIIDEYDTPIQQGHACGFYDEVILFMRNLFSGGLKDNRHLSFGFLTGILRVAKESIFSGLNNIAINSVLDHKYSEYFGFIPDEVKEMAAYFHAEDKYEEICQWYDGYQFGETEIFNPWSVINYFRNRCQAKAYWQSTGSNEIIGEIVEKADEEVYQRLYGLLQGKTFLTYVDTGVIYPQISKNPSSIYSFLLVAGYLKLVRSEIAFNGDFMCEVAIPNKEIAFVYHKEILQKLEPIFPPSVAISIQEAVYGNDAAALQKHLHKFLLQSVSFHDTVGENFYHGFVLGLCAILENRYIITSNRESGEGRYDISLCPKDPKAPGILIELKAGKDCTESQLKELAGEALAQIKSRQYDTEMAAKNIQTIFRYGVAFSGKKVEVATE